MDDQQRKLLLEDIERTRSDARKPSPYAAPGDEIYPPADLKAFLGSSPELANLQSAIEFDLNKLRVFQQSHDFDPHDFIEEVLTHRPVVADRAGKPPIFV